MLGYAVTCTADSTTEARENHDGLLRLWTAVERAPKPGVIVIADVGPGSGAAAATWARSWRPPRAPSAPWAASAIRACAMSPKCARSADFQYFCPGFVVSHGRAVIIDVGRAGRDLPACAIAPGDLLHGDVNGLLTVPDIETDRLLAEVEAVRDEERALLEFIRQPGLHRREAASPPLRALTCFVEAGARRGPASKSVAPQMTRGCELLRRPAAAAKRPVMEA